MDHHRLAGTVWRHKRTERLYTVVGACRLEHSNSPAYLYKSHEDGITWARDMDEFLDGRFECLGRPEDNPALPTL